MSIRSVFISVGCAYCIFFLVLAHAYAEHYIKGFVFDKHDNPIPHVLVRVFRNGQKLPGEDRTKKEDGSYEVQFLPGSPISIQYDHTEYHVARFEHICGSTIHNVSKVLYGLEEKLSEEQKRGLFSTLSQVYYQDKQQGLDDSIFLAKYSNSIKNAGFSIDTLAEFPLALYAMPNFMISSGEKSVYATIAEIGSFNTFAEIVKKAGYDQALKYQDAITLFAPTDNAFKKLPGKQMAYINKYPKEFLEKLETKVIFHHVIDWKTYQEKIGKDYLCGVKVIYPDIPARNGLIHAVDNIVFKE